MTQLRYPVTISNGELALTQNQNVEAVLSVLQTVKGERVYRPDYGTPSPLFSATNNRVLTDLGVDGVDESITMLYGGLIVDVPFASEY